MASKSRSPRELQHLRGHDWLRMDRVGGGEWRIHDVEPEGRGAGIMPAVVIGRGLLLEQIADHQTAGWHEGDAHGPGVRVDTGVYPGFEISPYYGSLISKLICWGETCGEAILRMRRSLEECRIIGVKTNFPFHQSIMDSHRFMAGQYDTRSVEECFSIDQAEEGRKTLPDIAAILATLVAHREGQQASQIVRRGERDTSNWKWVGRWERMHC